jgi:hypothetical protein
MPIAKMRICWQGTHTLNPLERRFFGINGCVRCSITCDVFKDKKYLLIGFCLCFAHNIQYP